jgi:monoamine oxidase
LRPFGRPLIEGFFGGRLAHELEAAGPGAFFDFAVAELVELFGSGIRVDGRLFFAGEACSRHDFATAHGAYLTGIEAANQAIALRPRGIQPSAAC